MILFLLAAFITFAVTVTRRSEDWLFELESEPQQPSRPARY